MSDRVNKTSICSIVFLDIIDFSIKSDAEQIHAKNQFNDLISRSLKDVALNDRIILDTGDGVAIALLGSPEDAMFVALTICDGVVKNNVINLTPMYVRFGINLGPVRIVNDINGQPNIIGDGINVAQRIMSFAGPNQILVSRSYYEVTSRLTLEFSEMFDYSGVKHDKHVREHEVYSVRTHKDHAPNVSKPLALTYGFQLPKLLGIGNKNRWKYLALPLFSAVVLLGLIKFTWLPSEVVATNALPKQHETADKSAENLVDVNRTNNSTLTNTDNVTSQAIANVKVEHESVPVNGVATNTKDFSEEATNSAIIEDAEANTLVQENSTEKQVAKKESIKKQAAEKQTDEKYTESAATSAHATKHSVTAKTSSVELHTNKSENAVDTKKAVADKKEERSGFKIFTDSIKQGKKAECTQAQILMGQCR
ncbi:MAG TPA: adenylate/guanylate cyclase domain-containing protein [Acinetobacter johnsonii]|nr:adenylate/guanylate cyclase domain-containing protein [Acinetobacter johnsonii]